MRRLFSFLVTGLVVGLFVTLPAQRAYANDGNQLTYFTFSAPFAIPGVALPAGTYMFRLADSESDSQIVRVFSKDGAKLYATFFALPDQRLTPTDTPSVTLDEAPAGAPEPVKSWFYPGNTTGHEFMYPHELVYPQGQVGRIAAATHQLGFSTPLVTATPTTGTTSNR
jgi:hypothetical protein